MADEEAAPDLTLDNVLLQLTKHGFPANKWGELATHLHQENNDSSPQLADVIERWLASDDESRSWRGLVDAVVRCKEMNVAKPLAHEVKVPFPGAHRQWTPSKPSSQPTSTSHDDDSMSAAQLRESHSAGNNTQQQDQSSNRVPPSAGSSSSSSRSSVIRSSRRPRTLACLSNGTVINSLLGLASASAYYLIGDQKRSSTIGHVLVGVFGYAWLCALSHKLGSKPVDVGGVKVPRQAIAAFGGIGLGCLHAYLRS